MAFSSRRAARSAASISAVSCDADFLRVCLRCVADALRFCFSLALRIGPELGDFLFQMRQLFPGFAKLAIGFGFRGGSFSDRGTDAVGISAELRRQNFAEEPDQAPGYQYEVDPLENFVGMLLRGVAALFRGVDGQDREQDRKEHGRKNWKPANH